MEKHLVSRHQLVVVRGKRGSKVPVLLPADVHELLEFIANADVRKEAGIDGSAYFFANLGNSYLMQV